MSLYLVGLGPDPELLDLTRRAQEILLRVDEILLDSVSGDAVLLRQKSLQSLLHKPVDLLRALEQPARLELYQRALVKDLAIAVAGDPLVESPYVYWLCEAEQAACPVHIIPGLSALTALPSLAGIDAGRCQLFRLADFAKPDLQMMQNLRAAFHRGPCLVIYSGKQAAIDDDKWRDFAQNITADFKLLRIGKAGASLLLNPKK